MSSKNDLIHPVFQNALDGFLVSYELPRRCVNCSASLDDRQAIEVEETDYCSLECVSEFRQTQAEMWADDEDRYRDR